ncbi:hypothetical protein SAMN04488030_1635 [Aliiroseovarius halocynthiae]|uniref:DUF4345 domain-containing protein n=1 Tax=Aliiroseovarius halocynthiae TaxID=985055 RepID=A0A545SX02_9RHOB|nr:hypothetical protein [Aliiroseovarius halocynthiae]TQV69490.1 hypothetical protein FIL88_08080 [Aliiroseovarius halocynthiae]SMR72890.1 hypothetical protein SAMN04488030_1635 [Aliiroseovarius halocynthiae]
MSFKTTMIATTTLCGALSIVLMVTPALIYFLFEVTPHESGTFFARRAAVMFFGVATTAFLARGISELAAQHAIALGLGVMMLGLAILGLFEMARGMAGPGILIAVVTEIAFAAAFLRLLRTTKSA